MTQCIGNDFRNGTDKLEVDINNIVDSKLTLYYAL